MQKQRRISSIWSSSIGIEVTFDLELAHVPFVKPIKSDLCKVGKRRPACGVCWYAVLYPANK